MRPVSTRFAVAVVLAATALSLVPSLFTRDPWNPDEPRAAEVAREMAELGNYLVPHLNGEPYSDKPPVFYWLASIFWHAGAGVNSGRLVSLLATIGTLLLVYALGRRLQSPETGLLAALITLTTLLFAFISRFGVLDPLLSFFTTASIYCATRALDSKSAIGNPHFPWWLAAYALAALAVLTKGPVGLAVPLLVAVAYGALRRREARKGGWWHLAGSALLIALVLAWLIPACLRGGPAYTKDILFQQTAQRVGGEEASHYKPPYFYIAYCPVFFAPWMLILVAALAWGAQQARNPKSEIRDRDTLALLASAWFILVLVFFSLFSGKRERYLLPLVPAVGLLCARYIVAVLKGEIAPLRWHQGLWKATFVVIGLVAIGLVVVALDPGAVARRFTDDSEALAALRAAMSPAVLLGAGLTGAAVLAACFYGIRLPRGAAGEGRRAVALVAAMLALSLSIDLLATPLINDAKSGRDLVDRAGPYLRDADEVFLFQSDFSGVYNLFTRRTRMPVLCTPAEVRKALAAPRRLALIAKESRGMSARDLERAFGARLVAAERVGHRKVLVLANWTQRPGDAGAGATSSSGREAHNAAEPIRRSR